MAFAVVVLMVALPLLTSERTSPVVAATPTATPTVALPASPVPGDAPLDQCMEVAGRVGAVPVVTLRGPLTPVQDVLSDIQVNGSGRVVGGGEPVMLSVSTFSGADGANTTVNGQGRRIFLGPLTSETVGPDLSWRIVGLREGTRLVLRSPVAQDSGGTITEITVVDVIELRSHGKPLESTPDMPAFSMADDGSVTLSTSGLAEPTTSRASVLIEGDGEQIKGGDTLIARYTMVSWTTGETITSCYGNTTVPCRLALKDMMTAAADHLLDVPVGSRVLITLPAAQARGDVPVALVIDVLAVKGADSPAGGPTDKPSEEVVVVTPKAQAEGDSPSSKG